MLELKSKSEIKLMQESGKILYETLCLLKEKSKPGITTLELDKIAEDNIRKYGAIPSFKNYKVPGASPFPGSICASVNEEVVHGIPGKRVLVEGDILSIDIGVFYKGFHTDAARTLPIGEISDEAKRLIQVTRESFYKGIEQMREGNRIVDISSAIEAHAMAAGYSLVEDLTGHGIGRNLHEDPSVPNFTTRGKGPRIKEGLVLAIEPMVNEGTYKVEVLPNDWTIVTGDGKLSAHYENTVALTENGTLLITKPEV